MILFAPFIILCSQFVFWCGTYFVWPSRWNIYAHVQLGFFISAFAIPVLFLGVMDEFTDTAIEHFIWILAVGTVGSLFGLFLGCEFTGIRLLDAPRFLRATSDKQLAQSVYWCLIVVLILGTVGILFYFRSIGTTPAFSDNPMQAKFQRGEFESGAAIKTLYRVSFHTLLPALAVAMLLVIRRELTGMQRMILMSVTTVATLCVLLTLVRYPLGFAGLMVLGIYVLPRRRATIPFVLGVTLTVGIGSAGIVWLQNLRNGERMESLVEAVGEGSPDIPDIMRFIENFHAEDFTWGRTFFGALVPNRYRWNPAIWSLRVYNQRDDESKFVSGGLRLPVSVWGYTAFGYPGAFFVSLLSAFCFSYSTKVMARTIQPDRPVRNVFLFSWYCYVAVAISRFYFFGYFDVVQAGVTYLLCWAAGRHAPRGPFGRNEKRRKIPASERSRLPALVRVQAEPNLPEQSEVQPVTATR